MSNENKEKYQLGDCWLIQLQILQTNITWIVWQIEKRITSEILGVKGLNFLLFEFIILLMKSFFLIKGW